MGPWEEICVDGDESKVSVVGCTYMTQQYSIPGKGMFVTTDVKFNGE